MASRFKFCIICRKQRGVNSFCFKYVRNTLFRSNTVCSISNGVGEDSSRVKFITDGCDIEQLENVQDLVCDNLLVYDEFVTPQEEETLYKELRTSLEKKSYQHEHWDDAIHGYRETEKATWSKDSMMIFKRIKDMAFKPKHNLLPYVHVLDLDSKGFIKPHIDSVKFCGSTIAGVSILSPSIMRFCHESIKGVTIDVLLTRRSLYICRNAVRYHFTHEILSPEQSIWQGKIIERARRISLILRCEPEPGGT